MKSEIRSFVVARPSIPDCRLPSRLPTADLPTAASVVVTRSPVPGPRFPFLYIIEYYYIGRPLSTDSHRESPGGKRSAKRGANPTQKGSTGITPVPSGQPLWPGGLALRFACGSRKGPLAFAAYGGPRGQWSQRWRPDRFAPEKGHQARRGCWNPPTSTFEQGGPTPRQRAR